MSEEVLGAEVIKLRGYLDRLWNLTKSEKLDRKECLNAISDVDRSLNAVFNALTLYFSKENAKLSPQELVSKEHDRLSLIELAFYNALSKAITRGGSNFYVIVLASIKHMLEHPEHYSDRFIIRATRLFCKELESDILLLEGFFELRRGVHLISELTSRFPQFTENWAIATLYLSAMETAVMKSLSERGEKIENEFKENVVKLVVALKEEGVHIGGLDEVLPPAFWELRNKVFHEGYSPTDEEIRTVITFVRKFLELSLTS